MSLLRFRSLLDRIAFAYLLPTIILFAVSALFAYRAMARSMEDSLGRRLTGIAHATAAQILPEMVTFLQVGDDESRTAIRLKHKLDQIRERTRVQRIFIIDPQHQSRADTDQRVRIGDRYYHAEADRAELQRVLAGEEASSVLFSGLDNRFYKTGYAPIIDEGQAVAIIGVEGSAEFFDVLRRLRNYLFFSGMTVGCLAVLITIFLARRITKPLCQLAEEAARIGRGELEQPIEIHSSDEVGVLASTMNEMRQALAERDQRMQMMLSGIAHEVRNPLGGIELFSGLLREELGQDAAKLAHLQRIERELTALKKVVGDFLDFARQTPLSLVPLADPRQLLLEAAEVLQGAATERQIQLKVSAPTPQNLPIIVDAEQIRRALINLAQNAIQAAAPGSEVLLSAYQQDQKVILEVQDQGCGISTEEQQKIFVPFYTTKQTGTGLGLPLARKIVEEHGGTLTVRSEPGRGANFYIALPRGA